MNSIRGMRRARALNVGVLAIEAAIFGFDLAIGSLFMILPLAWIVVFIAVICWQTRVIRRREYECRPRPDYAAIARLEREVYGEAVAWCRSPLCPCGGTLPQHIRSPHYLPGHDAGGRIRSAADPGPDAGTSGARHEVFRGNFNHVGASGDSRATVIGTVIYAAASGNAVIEICGTLLHTGSASGAAVIRVNGKVAACGPLARTPPGRA